MINNNSKSKTILVTGGSGKVGRVVVQDLVQHGYRVISADLKISDQEKSVRIVTADLTDINHVYRVAEGVNAIVHLAAIPSPHGYPPNVVFETNMLSTFNVLQAACDLGINRVVIASSLSALGLVYNTHPIKISYFPIDEGHPLLAQDVYGISKELGESLCDGFIRRNPKLSITTFRFPFLSALKNIPNAIENWRTNLEAGAKIFWSYLDVFDAAVVIRCALQNSVSGHRKFYVAAPETFVEEKTISLLKKYYPGVPIDEDKLRGFSSPIASNAAIDQLQFNPSINWHDRIKK